VLLSTNLFNSQLGIASISTINSQSIPSNLYVQDVNGAKYQYSKNVSNTGSTHAFNYWELNNSAEGKLFTNKAIMTLTGTYVNSFTNSVTAKNEILNVSPNNSMYYYLQHPIVYNNADSDFMYLFDTSNYNLVKITTSNFQIVATTNISNGYNYMRCNDIKVDDTVIYAAIYNASGTFPPPYIRKYWKSNLVLQGNYNGRLTSNSYWGTLKLDVDDTYVYTAGQVGSSPYGDISAKVAKYWKNNMSLISISNATFGYYPIYSLHKDVSLNQFYVGSYYGRVAAINTASLNTIWSVQYGNQTSGSPYYYTNIGNVRRIMTDSSYVYTTAAAPEQPSEQTQPYILSKSSGSVINKLPQFNILPVNLYNHSTTVWDLEQGYAYVFSGHYTSISQPALIYSKTLDTYVGAIPNTVVNASLLSGTVIGNYIYGATRDGRLVKYQTFNVVNVTTYINGYSINRIKED
jgi:hypothetical protein